MRTRTQLTRLARALGLCLALPLCAAAQTEGAAPVLVTEPDSTRAVALDPVRMTPGPFTAVAPVPFGADAATRVVVFATNVRLYVGETAGAFGAEAEDGRGRTYRLKVEHAGPVPGFAGLTQFTVRLDPSMADAGDVLLRVTLRGMTSNRVRLAVGREGGGPPDDVGSVPTPAPAVPPAPLPAATPDPYTGPATSADAVRFLEQSSFGPTPAEVERAKAMGLRAYLEEQFAAAPSGYPTLPLVPIDSRLYCGSDYPCLRDNYTMHPLQTRFFRNAFYGRDQLRQRVAFALHQVFVVSAKDLNQASWYAPYLQALDRNAFGSFRALMHDVTLNAAMGEFLDSEGNTKEKPNENFAREILQLFTIGPDLLNADGTPRLDEQGNRTPAYTQATVNDFARVFTGWVYANPPAGSQGLINFLDPMQPVERFHDAGAKTLLGGAHLPAGQTAAQDLSAALDNIFNHPNVGPFVSQRLIRHLVTSNPSPAYVGRVSAVFDDNCAGFYPDAGCTRERGDLKSVVRAILLDPEARGDVKTDPAYGRLREPALYAAGLCRAFGVRGLGPGINNIVESDGYLTPWVAGMGQDIWKPPTVFGYYPDDYTVPGTTLRGPEFGAHTSTTVLGRVWFASQMVFRGGIGARATPENTTGTFINTTPFHPLAAEPAKLVAALDALLLHGTMTPAMRSEIIRVVETYPATYPNYLRDRTWVAVFLIVSSPQYHLQK
ncbi:MAG TPA: DUF1800 family protein [Pyrinomonadaceae bacterium]|nr:DUF1800 family protein [Pyrinomonadaceae bacterium]